MLVRPWLPALVAAIAAAAACAPETNVHETKQAKSQLCIMCHSAAFVQVQNPIHVGEKPVTCQDCHGTKAWIPTTGAGGHPEAAFPIQATTSKHHNPAIGCNDCHDASLGPSTAGANTDCIHCHIGAHTIASVDALHASVQGYTPANPSTPNACRNCHPTGAK